VGTLTVSGPRGSSYGRGTTLIPAGGTLSAAAVASSSTARLKGTTISGAEAVALIDEIPVLSVLATATEGGIEFSDAAELRVKESDRIATVATNLRAMGARCEEKPDGLIVPGNQKLHGAVLESFGDHRIAMAFSVAGLIAEGETTIRESECASISYPEFYATLDRIAER
jgi:3-phosphoshikimate 1-carboxyvinyltransferase